MSVVDHLVDGIRAALRAAADPARAAGQQAYMKSAMPYLGVTVPETRRIAKTGGAGTDAAQLRRAARTLWDEASFREERYAATALLRLAPGDPGAVPLIEHMVRTGQWWDITDELAGRLGPLLDMHPESTAAQVRRWSTDDDPWVRRVAILSQLGRRERVDRALLADVIEPNVDDTGFFIRKAIGWALRDTARVYPDWVRQYVATHDLSALSRREATKHLDGGASRRR